MPTCRTPTGSLFFLNVTKKKVIKWRREAVNLLLVLGGLTVGFPVVGSHVLATRRLLDQVLPAIMKKTGALRR